MLACFSLPVFPWYAPGTRPVERRESPALSPAASAISYIYGTSAPCHAGGHPKLGGAAARDVGESAGGAGAADRKTGGTLARLDHRLVAHALQVVAQLADDSTALAGRLALAVGANDDRLVGLDDGDAGTATLPTES